MLHVACCGAGPGLAFRASLVPAGPGAHRLALLDAGGQVIDRVAFTVR